MQKGDIAGPISAPNGFHVIQLVNVRGQTLPAPSQKELQNIAYQIKFQKEVKAWLKQLRKSAYVKVV